MGLSKTSITGKWDREWKRLYTAATHGEEENETQRIEKKEADGKRKRECSKEDGETGNLEGAEEPRRNDR